MTCVALRPLLKRDLAAAVAIVAQNYADPGYAAAAQDEVGAAFSRRAGRPSFVAAVSDGALVGFAGFAQSWMAWDIYELAWVNVAPSHQRRGIGRRLVDESLRQIGDKDGAELVQLRTALSEFYRVNFGFEIIRTMAGDYPYLMCRGL